MYIGSHYSETQTVERIPNRSLIQNGSLKVTVDLQVASFTSRLPSPSKSDVTSDTSDRRSVTVEGGVFFWLSFPKTSRKQVRKRGYLKCSHHRLIRVYEGLFWEPEISIFQKTSEQMNPSTPKILSIKVIIFPETTKRIDFADSCFAISNVRALRAIILCSQTRPLC